MKNLSKKFQKKLNRTASILLAIVFIMHVVFFNIAISNPIGTIPSIKLPIPLVVEHGQGFSNVALNLISDTTGKPPVDGQQAYEIGMQIMVLNQKTVTVMKSPEGKNEWIANSGSEIWFIPSGWSLNPDLITKVMAGKTVIVAPIPIVHKVHTPLPAAQIIPPTFSSWMWLVIIPLIAAAILVVYLALRENRNRARRANPEHPIYSGAPMRNVPQLLATLIPQTAGSTRQNIERIRIEENATRVASNQAPLTGNLTEIYNANATGGRVRTEYRDGSRMATASGQSVSIGVYRDTTGAIANMAFAFNACSNGMLFSRMTRDEVIRFVTDAIWSNGRRIWARFDFTASANWPQVEAWIKDHLAEIIANAPAAGIPITGTAGTTTTATQPTPTQSNVVQNVVAPTLPTPVAPIPSESTALISTPEQLPEAPALVTSAPVESDNLPQFALSSAQIEQLSTPPHEVSISTEQLSILVLLGVKFTVLAPVRGGCKVRYLGYGPEGLPQNITAVVLSSEFSSENPPKRKKGGNGSEKTISDDLNG